ncbi:MAG: J domain-containing protein [Thermodesulfobacteriota bacterium]|nr:J domain-containing protein [Thermodesulfobacteriota bacterium]
MTSQAPGAEVVHACRLLFPAAAVIDACFLETVTKKDLKTAFRKKALKTHPDRAKALGRSQEELKRLFEETTSAYHTLSLFFSGRSTRTATVKKEKPASPRPSPGRPARKQTADHFYTGRLPRRELRLGEYLYYSGLISWKTLISAIVWQKNQRPRFGEIARQWNFLTDEEVYRILAGKSWNETFGEYARRVGLLSGYQQMAVTGRQKQLQPMIGKHFINEGLFTPAEVDMMVMRAKQHNRGVGRR